MNWPWTISSMFCSPYLETAREKQTPQHLQTFLEGEWMCLIFNNLCILADLGRLEDLYQWHQGLIEHLKQKLTSSRVKKKRGTPSGEIGTLTVTASKGWRHLLQETVWEQLLSLKRQHSLEMCSAWESLVTLTGPWATGEGTNSSTN